MQGDFYFQDAAFVHVQDFKHAVLEGYLFVYLRELAFQLEHQSGQGVGISGDIGKGIFVDVGYFEEVDELSFAFKYPRVVVQFGVAMVFLVVFVAYVSDDFFYDVLHRDKPRGASELVYHDGYMYAVPLEVAQQVVYHFGFGDKVGGAYQVLPAEVVAFVQMWQQVLDVKYAHDVVPRVFVDGYAGIDILDDAFQDGGEGGVYVEVYHVKSGCHDFLGGFFPEAYDALQHVLLVGQLGLVGQFQCLREFVDRDGMALAHQFFVNEQEGVYPDGGEGVQAGAQPLHGGCCAAAEAEGPLVA